MQGNYKVMVRNLAAPLFDRVKRGQSVLLLGPRQVGKTTLVESCLDGHDPRLDIPLHDPRVRQGLEVDPGQLIRQVEAIKGHPIVFMDEAQKVPDLFDAVQFLIDRRAATFVITGSSARKLRRRGTNLLPGRVHALRLDPLAWGELGWLAPSEARPVPAPNHETDTSYDFERSLVFGTLPGIVNERDDGDRADALKAYATLYLEEEIRAEALTRKVPAFGRFLELAARESGENPNLSALSREAGVSAPTLKTFFGILEDTLVVERLDPYLRNARKRILSSPRYYFFDTGVRNALARLPLAIDLVHAEGGKLFEHAVVLEVVRRIRAAGLDWRCHYWRTGGGAEVDLVIDTGERLVPIEIKSGATVRPGSVGGLRHFMADYGVAEGFVIFRGRRPERLTPGILALPWEWF